EQVGDDTVAILIHEVDDAKRNAEVIGDGAGVDDVLLPRAIADDLVPVDRVLHVGGLGVVADLLQAPRGHGAVRAAGKGHQDALGFTHAKAAAGDSADGREIVAVLAVLHGPAGGGDLAAQRIGGGPVLGLFGGPAFFGEGGDFGREGDGRDFG